MLFFKWLDQDYEGTYRVFSYADYLPVDNGDGTYTPGAWLPKVKGKLEICGNGYHVSNLEWLWQWRNLGRVESLHLYLTEISKNRRVGDDGKYCARTIRLIKPLTLTDETWYMICDYYNDDDNADLRARLLAALGVTDETPSTESP